MRLDPRRTVQGVFLLLVTVLVVLILLPRTRAADSPVTGPAGSPVTGHHSAGRTLEATWYSQAGTTGACGTTLGDGHQRSFWYAASKDLPCGTKLIVHHGGRQHYAIVQDWGPRYADIDLSRRVFRRVADLSSGRITVWIVRR